MPTSFNVNSINFTTTDTVPPTTGTYKKGDILRDSNGNLWQCIESGNPGIWAKIVNSENAKYIDLDIPKASGLIDVEYTINANTITITKAIVNIHCGENSNVVKQFTIDTPFTYTFEYIDDYYIIARYNNGNPILDVDYIRNTANFITDVPIARVCWDGYVLRHEFFRNFGYASCNKLIRKDLEQFGNVITSGFALSEITPNRYIRVESGVAYYGLNRYVLNALQSDSADTILFYHDTNGNWTYDTVTQYDNLHYDTGNGLGDLTDGNYTINWIFRSTITERIVIVLGKDDYTLNMAIAAGLPEIPSPVDEMCVFVGRIIVQKGSNTAELIQNARNVFYGYSPTARHNDLAGLQGGQGGEYFHLTQAEYNKLTNLQHNDLANIQGGNPTERYHLDETQYNLLTRELDASPLHTHELIDRSLIRELLVGESLIFTYKTLDIIRSQHDNLVIPKSSLLIVNQTTNSTITGIVNPISTSIPYFLIILKPANGFSLTFTNENSSSLPENRIITNTGGSISLSGNGTANAGTIIMIYNPVILRWQVIGYIS